MDISIEMSLDRRVVERTGYTVLELLSDIGGVQAILISALSLLLNIWNYNYLQDYMASNLFQFKKQHQEEGPETAHSKTVSNKER